MRRAARGAAVVGMALALFGLGALGLFRAGRDGGTVPRTVGAPSLASLPLVGAGSLEQVIASLQDRIRAVPDDWRSLASLGMAYVQMARITADPSYYPKAEGVLEESLSLNPDENLDALVAMGALALARHDFGDALAWGERARAVNPDVATVHGVVGDALLELGRYPEAFRAFQRMVDLRPDLASYARASYARELQGDVRGAVRAMRLALGAAGTPEDAAWASYQLGELSWGTGRLAEAESFYLQAADRSPSWPLPRAGLARVAWARGDVDRAVEELRWVVERYPAPEFVIALGDLYRVTGQEDLAGEQYALARAEARLFQANGVNVDLELALFEADHGGPEAALEAASAEWARRQSVHVADAMAWALYANGRYEEAAEFAQKALGLGTKNALFLFHAGMIQLELGHRAEARSLLSEALALNPHFSILHGDRAARTLARLGGAA